jgi:hypothetical protein
MAGTTGEGHLTDVVTMILSWALGLEPPPKAPGAEPAALGRSQVNGHHPHAVTEACESSGHCDPDPLVP